MSGANYPRWRHRAWMDLHMHSTSSDGTDTPEQILMKARELGFSWFSLTDHDTYEGSEWIAGQVSREEDPRFIVGVELSCKDELGRYHILGYRFDPDHPKMLAIVKQFHINRLKKFRQRIRFLQDAYHIPITGDEIRELMLFDNPGKPHLANLLTKKGFTSSRDEAFGKYLNHIPEDPSLAVRPEEAIHAILEGGGIPILAHPIFGNGSQHLTWTELEERVDRLQGFGLQGLECYYSRYTSEQQQTLLQMAQVRQMYASAGSDYHGGNKKVSLGETGLAEESLHPCLERLLAAFEGQDAF